MARPQIFDRQQAVSKAVECFWLKGYSETSMADLLTAMGVSRSTFYNSFGDKRQVFELCLQTYSLQIEQLLKMTLLTHKGPAMDSIRQFLNLVFIAPSAELSSRGCLLVNSIAESACADESLNQLATELMQPVKAALIHQLSRELDDTESRHLGQWLFTQLLGWRLQCQMGLNQQEIEQQINHAMQLMQLHLFHNK